MISFASTLYLLPVLDLLLAEVPHPWRPQLRLGLQEALVNAARHGNKLDPRKQVHVSFWSRRYEFWWAIADQGSDQSTILSTLLSTCEDSCTRDRECGRGLFIVQQVFDEVDWDGATHTLTLGKRIRSFQKPLIE
jgi:anti-sigma regulatory factor (Ser/Thr protein kinase)